jgi:hypothetical protein
VRAQAALPKLGALLPPDMVGAYIKPGTNMWWILDQSGRVWEAENDPETAEIELVSRCLSVVILMVTHRHGRKRTEAMTRMTHVAQSATGTSRVHASRHLY